MENKKMSFGARIKEGLRKLVVSLKHKPQTIPMIMLAITFVYYSLNLTNISDTTALINRSPMGLCGFVVMLFSILSLVCFLNTFPNRKPVNKPMLILTFVMIAIILAADFVYGGLIEAAVSSGAIVVTKAKSYVKTAWVTLRVHEILLLVDVALVVLMPVYAKAIRSINTNVEVAAGQEMASIDISSED